MDSKFTFQVSHRLSNVEPYGYVNVTVADEVSGEVLFDGPFSDSQFRQLLSSSMVHVEGFVSDDLQRVGREMRTEVVQVPDEVTNGVHFADREESAKVWAENHRVKIGHETVRVDSTNRGYRAVFHAWGPASEAFEVVAEVEVGGPPIDAVVTERRVEVPALVLGNRPSVALSASRAVKWADRWMESNGYHSYTLVGTDDSVTHVDFRK
jgi:hypothetical protein